MLPKPYLDDRSGTPLYRQLYEYIRSSISNGHMEPGERLPSTRILAEQIGLNRTTVTAAYELLEEGGWIRSHVGRGSFVAGVADAEPGRLDWSSVLAKPEWDSPAAPVIGRGAAISFASSRPSAELFPVDAIRETAREVVESEAAEILQLGSPTGFPPLRRYLWESSRKAGEARDSDELIITSGCQQALDLLQRVLIERGDKVVVEDPVYPGIHQVLARAGARLVGVPVGPHGLDIERLEEVLSRESPKLLVVTTDFQNPTGATLPLEARRALLRAAHTAGVVVAENDIYADLRYLGEPLPSLKQLDDVGNVIQLRSFSKVSFPGLRVGWVLGPRPVIERLAEAKQWSDLHTDHLSQAVLCRFSVSGRLDEHRNRVIASGRERLAAALSACAQHLPPGSGYTRPEGGMSLWVELPSPLDSDLLLGRAQSAGVEYLPGRYFAVSRPHPGGLRLSFAGLEVTAIREGLSILGRVFGDELRRAGEQSRFAPAPAVV